MATLKLRIRGGKASICSVYAPHSGKPADERRNFYNELGEPVHIERSEFGFDMFDTVSGLHSGSAGTPGVAVFATFYQEGCPLPSLPSISAEFSAVGILCQVSEDLLNVSLFPHSESSENRINFEEKFVFIWENCHQSVEIILYQEVTFLYQRQQHPLKAPFFFLRTDLGSGRFRSS